MQNKKRELIEGQPVLVVIDIQGGESTDNDEPSALPFMPDYDKQMDRAPALIEKARECNIPIVFLQEAHRRDLIDFGRELDGAEGVHLLEGDPGTEIAKAVGMRPDDYFIRKRRYSCFFGTDFEILMKGLRANTLIFIGGHTDVCVHYAMEYLQTGARCTSEQVMAAFEAFENLTDR